MRRTTRRQRAVPAAPRAAVLAVLLAATLAVLTGCSSGGFSGIYSLPLPGGASLGPHPYQVTAQFADVNDLVPQSAVRVSDVAVGRVSRIYLPPGSWTAQVTMVLNGDVQLPADATAQVEQSSLLGEQYVALSAPSVPAAGREDQGSLRDHPFIPLSRTAGTATVEDVLGALSLLLNGGGIGQLHTITTQLNDALNGNEPQIRSVLTQIAALAANLNAHRYDITSALDGLNRLSATLSARDQQIGNVLDNVGPGLKVLEQQRGQLVTLLNSLRTLSGVAVSTINQSKADLVADLQALAPILRELADAGTALPKALQVLLTYPFTDQVLSDVKGDYLNTYLSVTAAPGTCIYAPLTPGAAATQATEFCPGQQPPASAASAQTSAQAAPLPLPATGSRVTGGAG